MSTIENLRKVARFFRTAKRDKGKCHGRCVGCRRLIETYEFPVDCIQRSDYHKPYAICPDCLPLWEKINKEWLVARELMRGQ